MIIFRSTINKFCLTLLLILIPCLAFAYTEPSIIPVSYTNGTIKYVDGSASGCNNGDTDYDPSTRTCGSGSSTVYLTYHAADGNVGAGNTLRFRAGTYIGEDVGNTHWNYWGESGSSGSPIIWDVQSGETVYLQAEIRFAEEASPTTAQYIIVDGGVNKSFIFQRDPAKGVAQTLLYIFGSHITIRRCQFQRTGPSCCYNNKAIGLASNEGDDGQTDIKIYNCEFDGEGDSHKGVYVFGARDWEIRNNILTDFQGHAIQLNIREDWIVSGGLIEGNLIYNLQQPYVTLTGVYTQYGPDGGDYYYKTGDICGAGEEGFTSDIHLWINGVHLTEVASKAALVNNDQWYPDDVTGYIYINYDAETAGDTVSYGLGNFGNGIVVDSQDNNGLRIDDVDIINNFIWDIDNSVGNNAGIRIVTGEMTASDSVEIYNNTIYDIDYAGIRIANSTSNNTIIVTNNITSQCGTYGIAKENLNQTYSYNVDNGNPTFQSETESHTDFLKLASNDSVARENGTDLTSQGVTVDYFDNSRPYGTYFDIGAHEYPGLVPTVSVTATDSSASEDGDNGNFRINRSNSSGNLNCTISMGGTATNGTDYQTISSPQTISDGDIYVDVALTVIEDGIYEGGSETVILNANSCPGYTIIDSSETISITDKVNVASPIEGFGVTIQGGQGQGGN